MIVPLKREYPSRHAVPIIGSVDAAIFSRTCSPHCGDSVCRDACCAFGVCVDLENVRRMEACAAGIERHLGIPREQWFEGPYVADAESPGGSYIRTRVVDGCCVFLNRRGRGCLLHSYCLDEGFDHHLLKPMLSSLFPLTFEAGLLRPSAEVADDTLACLDGGLTLYRGARDDLRYYFGETFVSELDALERFTPLQGECARENGTAVKIFFGSL